MSVQKKGVKKKKSVFAFNFLPLKIVDSSVLNQFGLSWARVHGKCARSSVAAWERRVLGSSQTLVNFSATHLGLKRPPTAASGSCISAQQNVLRPFNPDGFHFGKASKGEIVARFSPSAGSFSWVHEGSAEGVGSATEDDCPLFLNISPLWPNHCLFTPSVNSYFPQVATPSLFQSVMSLVVGIVAGKGSYSELNSQASAPSYPTPWDPCNPGNVSGD